MNEIKGREIEWKLSKDFWNELPYFSFVSPNFKDPTPPPSVFLITSFKSPVGHPAVSRLQRTTGRLKQTPILGSDVPLSRIEKENHLSTISTPTKATVLSDDSSRVCESPSKRQKQVLE